MYVAMVVAFSALIILVAGAIIWLGWRLGWRLRDRGALTPGEVWVIGILGILLILACLIPYLQIAIFSLLHRTI